MRYNIIVWSHHDIHSILITCLFYNWNFVPFVSLHPFCPPTFLPLRQTGGVFQFPICAGPWIPSFYTTGTDTQSEEVLFQEKLGRIPVFQILAQECSNNEAFQHAEGTTPVLLLLWPHQRELPKCANLWALAMKSQRQCGNSCRSCQESCTCFHWSGWMSACLLWDVPLPGYGDSLAYFIGWGSDPHLAVKDSQQS